MKTIIVTGANSGLGLWTTKYLLDRDYRVIMACRNLEKAQQAIAEFPEFPRNKTFAIEQLDLGDFQSIKDFVVQLSASEDLYGIVCNAGTTSNSSIRYTKNGIEETFGVNHLGHFLLTNLLLEQYPIERIVIISSALHDPKIRSPFANAVFRAIDELACPPTNTNTNLAQQAQEFYATSKLCNILFAYELDRRLKNKGLNHKISVNAFNPGFMPLTNLGRDNTSQENRLRFLLNFIGKLFGFATSAQESAKYVVRLIDAIDSSGKYYDKQQPIQSSVDSYDLQKAIELWEGSERLTNSHFLHVR